MRRHGAGVVSNETLFSITSFTCGLGLSQFNEPELVRFRRSGTVLIGCVCMMQERQMAPQEQRNVPQEQQMAPQTAASLPLQQPPWP